MGWMTQDQGSNSTLAPRDARPSVIADPEAVHGQGG